MSKLLTAELKSDINRIGISSIQSWLKENEISLPSSSKNFYDSVKEALKNGSLTIGQLQQAIAELEESGAKKILLYKIKNYKFLESNRAAILLSLRKKGIKSSDKNWIINHVGEAPGTFIYMFWDQGVLKLKFGEKQYENLPDPDTATFIKEEKQVRIIIAIDTKSGFTQLRLDTPGNKHRHKNNQNKTSETAYETFYVDLMKDLFPELEFIDYDLNTIANSIEANEKQSFRLTKGVASIVQNAKQTFAASGRKTDVRDLPNYKGALAQGGTWNSDDLTGYWIANSSEGELKKDLFMRISRRFAYIRVQRGCLEKELMYGITKIRQIQNEI